MILLTILIGAAIAWPLVDYLSATASEAFQSDERGFVFGLEPIDDAIDRHADRDRLAKFPSLHATGVADV